MSEEPAGEEFLLGVPGEPSDGGFLLEVTAGVVLPIVAEPSGGGACCSDDRSRISTQLLLHIVRRGFLSSRRHRWIVWTRGVTGSFFGLIGGGVWVLDDGSCNRDSSGGGQGQDSVGLGELPSEREKG